MLKKRLISCILIALMVANICIPAGAYATTLPHSKDERLTKETSISKEAKKVSGDFEYVLDGKKATITKYLGNDSRVVVPSVIDNYKVDVVGYDIFSYNPIFEEIIFSEGIRVLDLYVIDACENLKYVYLPSTLEYFHGNSIYGGESIEKIELGKGCKYFAQVGNAIYNKDKTKLIKYAPGSKDETVNVVNGTKSIEESAFLHSRNVKTINLPSSLERLEFACFGGASNLTNLVIPEKCTFIGQYVFEGTGLTKIHIPKNVSTILWAGISRNHNLKTITVAKENKYYFAHNNVLYEGNRNKPEYGYSLLTYAANKTVSSYTVLNGTYYIHQFAFQDAKNLKKVVLPPTLEIIGSGAFYDCIKLDTMIICGNISEVEDTIIGNQDKFKNLYFLGDCPKAINKIVNQTSSIYKRNVYYPANNSTYNTFVKNSLNKGYTLHKMSSKSVKDMTLKYYPKHCALTGKNHAIYEELEQATPNNDGSYKAVCTWCGKKIDDRKLYKASKVTISKTEYLYNGKVKNPKITVKNSKGNIISPKYYTIIKPTGRKNVGKYTYKVKFKGFYTGSKSFTITIKPNATSLDKVIAGNDSLTVKWKKGNSQITGYEVRLSTSKDFCFNRVTYTVKGYKKTSKKFTGLFDSRDYYVKIRTYTKVKQKNGKYITLRSKWSKPKYCKTY